MLSARTLAVLYDLHLAAIWRGEEPTSLFGTWLQARWLDQQVTLPEMTPTAISVLGGSGGGIRWYEFSDSVIGLVTGRPNGCYLVTRDDEAPRIAGVDASMISSAGIEHPV